MKTQRWTIVVAVACGALGACEFGADDSPNSWPQLSAQRFTGTEDTVLDGQIVATDPDDTSPATSARQRVEVSVRR